MRRYIVRQETWNTPDGVRVTLAWHVVERAIGRTVTSAKTREKARLLADAWNDSDVIIADESHPAPWRRK